MYHIEIQNAAGEWERRSEFTTAYPLTAICDCARVMAQCLKRIVRVVYRADGTARVISQFEAFARPGHYTGQDDD